MMKPSLLSSSRLLPALAAALMAASVQAGDWEKIVGQSGRTVEIDKSAIFDSDHGTKVSWGRIVLNAAEAKQAGYHTIKALNRYDCLNRNFMTIKRVYLDDDENVLREETVPEQAPTMVRRNSVDERIWRKMCGLGTPDGPLASDDKGNKDGRDDKDAGQNAVEKPTDKLDRIAAAAGQAAQDAAKAGKPPQERPHARSALRQTPSAKPIKTGMTQPPSRVPPPPKALPPLPPPPAAAARKPLILPAPLPKPRTAERQAPAHPATPSAPVMRDSENWSYFGAKGPDTWGRLNPDWKLCAEGTRQSPIDIGAVAPVAVDLEPVKIDYRPSRFVITHTDRLLRVKTAEEMSMEVRGQRYALEGFALHRPAETRVEGRVADMELHFFHRDDKGRIAVLAVHVVRDEKPNALLQTLLNNLPLEKNDSYMPQAMIDLAAFLPKSPAHYLYMGSLTMPPCTENVLWVVMKEPVSLSEEQYGIFSRLHASNARPPQPANARLILESR